MRTNIRPMLLVCAIAIASAISPQLWAGGLTDCNENGVDDAQDIANLTSPDFDSNGVPDECQILVSSGAAYVYRFDGSQWFQEAKLGAFDATVDDKFGRFVSLNANRAVIRATGVDCGAVYVYRYDDSTANSVEAAKLVGFTGRFFA